MVIISNIKKVEGVFRSFGAQPVTQVLKTLSSGPEQDTVSRSFIISIYIRFRDLCYGLCIKQESAPNDLR